MENEFLDKVEDNVAIRIWSEKSQEKGDGLMEGYILELWDFTRIRDQWDDEIKQLFYREYGNLPYLLDVKVDKHII
ncbi:hypothetical protein Goarm_003147 [Gossypium armourianum]|uniref:Uncharacterized protein n=1 Tax=Gossypium armourianum TaxID=34283 RepID=A0A7J9K296_9ROSI|nr:hypothetical protein [Gossypium armourianum]